MSALPVPDDRPHPPAPPGWTERAADGRYGVWGGLTAAERQR